jgi:hypothetical protein
MKTLLLILALLAFVNPQKPAPKISPELLRLRDEFVKATEEYKTSLMKLASFYETDVTKAEEKLAQSKKQLADGMIARSQVEENERHLAAAKEKAAEIKRQVADADRQIADALDTAKLERELAEDLKRAKAERRKQRAKPCQNWDVMISQRQTARSVSFSYKLVCR